MKSTAAANNKKSLQSLLTVNEVAGIINVSVSTVYKWADESRLPYIDLGMVGRRRCLRFHVDDVADLIQNSRKI